MANIESESSEQTNISEVIKQIESSLPIELIQDPNSPRIPEIASLDAESFGAHKSLTAEDLSGIIAKGGVLFGHISPEGKIVSEATLVLNADSEGLSTLERSLPAWLAYCDGAAVSQSHRGKGLQKELLTAREKVAEVKGKEASAASVRHRNLSSIRSMLRNGYVMIADAPGYYGDGEEDDRVVMLKQFSEDNPMSSLTIEHQALEIDHKGITQPVDVADKIDSNADVIGLPVQHSDEVDGHYNTAVAALLRNGYTGVACHDLDIGDSDGERESVMVFVKLDTLGSLADKFSQRQSELQDLLDSK